MVALNFEKRCGKKGVAGVSLLVGAEFTTVFDSGHWVCNPERCVGSIKLGLHERNRQ